MSFAGWTGCGIRRRFGWGSCFDDLLVDGHYMLDSDSDSECSSDEAQWLYEDQVDPIDQAERRRLESASEAKRRRVDQHLIPSSVERSVQKIGDDASDAVKEGAVRLLEKAESEQVKVHVFLKKTGLDSILLSVQPPEVAIIACFAARYEAMNEGPDRWCAYLFLPELLPSWLEEEQIGGRARLPALDAQWSGSGINQAGQSLLNTFDHLGSLKQRPMFFPSASQFWGGFWCL